MPLPAGRKGVQPSDVTFTGEVIHPTEIPKTTASDAGKILVVDSSGKIVLVNPNSLPYVVPIPGAADEGKVLTVKSDGTFGWIGTGPADKS